MNKSDDLLKKAEDVIKKSGNFVVKEYGEVIEIKDGVALLSGLSNISFGEVIQFENGVKGYVIDIDKNNIGIIVLGNYLGIKSGDKAYGLGYTLSVPVSNEMIGRVVNPLGEPVDGGEKFSKIKLYPVEKIAPGVIKRKSVDTPIQTGLKVIDSLIPIGRGQRELIIGDRGTGKTTIAIDTIINQKKENVICIYCAVGQRNSKIASVIEILKQNEAMGHTIIVSASASDSASLQYLAPYSATAIAEYFMDQGKDVLVVYDDLTKHAWAYRQVSLILRRPAGREAYPGDVFYLHSKLLERACRIDEKYGGGSITALPIIETLEGDLSTYIPTNVISITDGQIFLETDLFNSGIKPAVNIGLSVSRVGGAAQTKAMKKVAGKLKLDLAQYREMAAFSQFEGELDEQTKNFLNRGARLTQILIQDKNQPYSLAHQVAVIYAASTGMLDKIDVSQIKKIEEKIINHLNTAGKKWIERVNKNKIMDEKDEEELKKLITEVL
ncbi:MAG: F0F1 ATP synthase subunit alpha [Patescibacteria group bacterium]|nr:F0F1 ATP synthase subunit alpha [Patescibacteria group bacterium]